MALFGTRSTKKANGEQSQVTASLQQGTTTCSTHNNTHYTVTNKNNKGKQPKKKPAGDTQTEARNSSPETAPTQPPH
jgi:hypothetical protein